MDYTLSNKRILTEGYEEGYIQGIRDALEDPEEARSYLVDAPHYLAWKAEAESQQQTTPSPDNPL